MHLDITDYLNNANINSVNSNIENRNGCNDNCNDNSGINTNSNSNRSSDNTNSDVNVIPIVVTTKRT